MKLLKKIAIAAAVSSITLVASAMTPIADTELSQVSGQDGVSIAASLNVNIGSFTYSDTNANGGSVSFNNIGITGTVAATLDIVNAVTFETAVFTPSAAGGLGVLNPTTMPVTTPAQITAATAQATALAAFYPGTDVVKIAIPNIATDAGLNVTVGSITMGNASGAAAAGSHSFGSFAMNDITLQGTTVYIWAH